MTLKFKDIRNYMAKHASPVSINMIDTGNYENYIEISLVPEEYNELYLYGIGSYEDYFDLLGEQTWMNAVEIVLSKNPRFD